MPIGNRVLLPYWEVLGVGESIIPNGSTVNATIPDGTEIVQIAAEGGIGYYQFGGIASALSAGFVPDNGRVIEGPLHNLTALAVFALAGVTLHILYYRQK